VTNHEHIFIIVSVLVQYISSRRYVDDLIHFTMSAYVVTPTGQGKKSPPSVDGLSTEAQEFLSMLSIHLNNLPAVMQIERYPDGPVEKYMSKFLLSDGIVDDELFEAFLEQAPRSKVRAVYELIEDTELWNVHEAIETGDLEVDEMDSDVHREFLTLLKNNNLVLNTSSTTVDDR